MSSTMGFVQKALAVHPKRQLKELYIFLALFSVAAALITVFEPVFLWQQGFKMWEIAMYYAIHYGLYALVLPLGAMFAAKFGLERALTVSTPIFVAYFLILARLPQNPNLFWVAIPVLTIFKTFYWPAYHASFAKYSDGSNGGTEQSWVRLIQYGAAIIGPGIGGFVAASYGFPTLFIFVAITVAIAGASLLRTRERFHSHDLKYSEVWQFVLAKRQQKLWSPLFAWVENLIYLAVWPVFVFIALGSISSLGYIASFSAAVATVWGFVVGEMTDKRSPRKTLRLLSPYMAVGYLWRAVAVLPWQVMLGDIIARTSTISIAIPFVSRLYKQGKDHKPLLFSTSFEMMLVISKAIGALALMFIFFFMPLPLAFITTFLLAAFLSLLYATL